MTRTPKPSGEKTRLTRAQARAEQRKKAAHEADRTNPCTDRYGHAKRRWPNEQAAAFVALVSWQYKGVALTYYECKRCGGWHNTSSFDRIEPDDANVRDEHNCDEHHKAG